MNRDLIIFLRIINVMNVIKVIKDFRTPPKTSQYIINYILWPENPLSKP